MATQCQNLRGAGQLRLESSERRPDPQEQNVCCVNLPRHTLVTIGDSLPLTACESPVDLTYVWVGGTRLVHRCGTSSGHSSHITVATPAAINVWRFCMPCGLGTNVVSTLSGMYDLAKIQPSMPGAPRLRGQEYETGPLTRVVRLHVFPTGRRCIFRTFSYSSPVAMAVGDSSDSPPPTTGVRIPLMARNEVLQHRRRRQPHKTYANDFTNDE